MARNDDRNRIPTEGIADGAGGAGPPYLLGDIAVGTEVTEGYLGGRVEDGLGERRDAGEIERNHESVPRAQKVFVELTGDPGDGGPIGNRAKTALLEVALEQRFALVGAEPNLADALVAGGDEEGTDRAVDLAIAG